MNVSKEYDMEYIRQLTELSADLSPKHSFIRKYDYEKYESNYSRKDATRLPHKIKNLTSE